MKHLLEKGLKIESVNGIKTGFTLTPADGTYKVRFGEEEFIDYFKEFLRPQIQQLLF
jgi:V/A-type H+-transporting ATPase subunit E